jgi:predicted transcriptional regulator
LNHPLTAFARDHRENLNDVKEKAKKLFKVFKDFTKRFSLWLYSVFSVCSVVQAFDFRFPRARRELNGKSFSSKHLPIRITMYSTPPRRRKAMPKTATLTVRVKPDTKERLDALTRVTHRSRSFMIEEALEQYLEINEWQTQGIEAALAEADSPDAEWVDHEAVMAERENKGAH